MSEACREYKQGCFNSPDKLYKGLDAVCHDLVGQFKNVTLSSKNLLNRGCRIHDKASELSKLQDRDLDNLLLEYKSIVRRKGCYKDQVLNDSLAALVELAERTLGLRPFPVQIMCTLSLLKGYLAEMATGEGKTLAAALAAAIVGWRGDPCHIITVNDYLAERDADSLGSFYSRAGVSVGHVVSSMQSSQRRTNYSKDVVYTTSKEILADFLRDRIKLGKLQHPSRRLLNSFLEPEADAGEEPVMRGLCTGIVDEADSVLIDEAVTPLIISWSMENRPLKEAVSLAMQIASGLSPGIHYTVERKFKNIYFSKKGKEYITSVSKDFEGLWRGKARREELVLQALKAREFYLRDQQYVVQEGKIVIVDEFSGRLMPARSWSHGLHQAVEVKEGLEITDPAETLARQSFQKFFRYFSSLSGMSGTIKEAAREFWQIYRLPILAIPTNRPCLRDVWPERVFLTKQDKWNALLVEVITVHQSGRPVLVGTKSVEDSEMIAFQLEQKDIDCQVINAVRHKEEAAIVACAGQKGKITIATNMAGRGTDIKLDPEVAAIGGLHVTATERHESSRIDRQLFGRCARQGDPGSARAFVSLEDDLIKRFVPQIMQRVVVKISNKNNKELLGRITYAYTQNVAERLSFRQRKNVLKNDSWLEEALSFTGSELEF